MSATTARYDPESVRRLFNDMAATYGHVNLLSSFGFTVRWRHQVVEVAPHEQLAAREVHPAELRPALEEERRLVGRHLVSALLLPDAAHLAPEVAVIRTDERHFVGQGALAHVGAEHVTGEAEQRTGHDRAFSEYCSRL